MNYIYVLFVTILTLTLSSCTTTFARIIDDAENSDERANPTCHTQYAHLRKTIDVNLDHYKPVQTRLNQKKDFALAVAISGGGYRSANLGLGVMLGLEDIRNKNLENNLLQEVDYFSTVSGGGLAVGFYLAKLHNFLDCYSDINRFSLRAEVNRILLNDCCCNCPNPLRADLTPYLFSNNERVGFRIERILNDTLLCTHQGGLIEGDIFVDKNSARAVQLPYWAINTTVYQNAAVFPFTPDVIDAYRITGYYHKDHHYYLLNPRQSLGYSVPVSVGLMASLSIPIVFPATTLESSACPCGGGYLHLYDGALVDNLGINTALSLLSQDNRKIKILMVIDSGRDLMHPFSKCKNAPEGIPLTVHLTSISVDGYRKYIKNHLDFIANKILCSKNTSNVITIYLDLDRYPNTQHIKSRLKMSLHDQNQLIKIGRELVQKDKTLNEFLYQLSEGKVTMGSCK